MRYIISITAIIMVSFRCLANVPIATLPMVFDAQSGAYITHVASINFTTPQQKTHIPQDMINLCLGYMIDGKPQENFPEWGAWSECTLTKPNDTWADIYQRFISEQSIQDNIRLPVVSPNTPPPSAASICVTVFGVRGVLDDNPIIGPDIMCQHPNPSNESCVFDSTDLLLDFGTVSSGNGQKVNRSISATCTSTVDVVLELTGFNGSIKVVNANGDIINTAISFDDMSLKSRPFFKFPVGSSQHTISATLPVGSLRAGKYSGQGVLVLNTL